MIVLWIVLKHSSRVASFCSSSYACEMLSCVWYGIDDTFEHSSRRRLRRKRMLHQENGSRAYKNDRVSDRKLSYSRTAHRMCSHLQVLLAGSTDQPHHHRRQAVQSTTTWRRASCEQNLHVLVGAVVLWKARKVVLYFWTAHIQLNKCTHTRKRAHTHAHMHGHMHACAMSVDSHIAIRQLCNIIDGI